MQNELQHHGIKGMKWGHRKKQENKEKTKNKKNIKKKVMIGLGISSIILGSYIVKNYLDKYSDKTIKANKEILHLGKNTISNLNQTFYASFIKSDKNKYLNSNSIGHDNKWNIKQIITSNKDIKIAGKKTSLKAFKEWASNNETYKRIFGNLDTNNRKGIEKAYNTFIKEAPAGSEYYRNLSNDFFKELSNKGYQATRDTFDQRVMKTKAPIIIFDKFNNLKTVKVDSIKRR